MKKVLSMLAALSVAALAFTGCGGDTAGNSSSSAAKTLKVGATAVPHAEILEAVKPVLEKDGVKLEIVEFNDYVQPNLALNDKELDANFFQHKPYLDNFMEEHKDVKLVSAFGVHIEPMGIYSKKIFVGLKNGIHAVLKICVDLVCGTSRIICGNHVSFQFFHSKVKIIRCGNKLKKIIVGTVLLNVLSGFH